jgi:hypothetical protein
VTSQNLVGEVKDGRWWFGKHRFAGGYRGIKRNAYLVPLFLKMSDHVFHDACTLLGLRLFAAVTRGGRRTDEKGGLEKTGAACASVNVRALLFGIVLSIKGIHLCLMCLKLGAQLCQLLWRVIFLCGKVGKAEEI